MYDSLLHVVINGMGVGFPVHKSPLRLAKRRPGGWFKKKMHTGMAECSYSRLALGLYYSVSAFQGSAEIWTMSEITMIAVPCDLRDSTVHR